MEDSNLKLTIAIPTYNRLSKLKQTLARVLEITEGKPVEVLISDNGSTDGTREYLQTIAKKQVHSFLGDKNMGMDWNFLNCFNKASGEYVMLLGDDDLLLEKGLCSILKAIEKKPVFIHVNTSGLIEDAKGQVKITAPRHQEEGFLVYQNRDQFLQEVGVYITFVSSLVFRTEYVREIQNKEQYIGTVFIQSHIALRTMEHEGSYIFDTVNCCAASGNKTVWYDLFYVWGKCFGDLMYKTAIQSGFDENVVDEITHRAFTDTVLGFVWYFRKTSKEANQWDKSAMWQYVQRYPDLWRSFRWAMDCPRWLIPVARRVDRLLLKMKKVVF